MRSEASWSCISDRPVFLYDPHYDIHLCYWNGVAMTRSHALIIIGLIFFGIYPAKSQREEAWHEFNRAYSSGAFATRVWDDLLHDMEEYTFHSRLINWITRSNSKFFSEMKDRYTPQEVLAWCTSDKELECHA